MKNDRLKIDFSELTHAAQLPVAMELSSLQMHNLTMEIRNRGLFGDCVVRATAEKIGFSLYVCIITKRLLDGALFEWSGRLNLKGKATIIFTCHPAS